MIKLSPDQIIYLTVIDNARNFQSSIANLMTSVGKNGSHRSTPTSHGASTSRRLLLRRGLGWLVMAAIGYPLFRFLGFHLPKKPVRVKIEHDLGLRGFALERDFILFVDQDQAWAVSRRCTHLGCTLSYDETARQLVCPCHHSQFNQQGHRLAGPAKRNLTVYPVDKAPPGSKGYIVTL